MVRPMPRVDPLTNATLPSSLINRPSGSSPEPEPCAPVLSYSNHCENPVRDIEEFCFLPRSGGFMTTGAVDPRRDVILTGIGGQGIQLCAKVLATAAVTDGRHAMLSSYFGGEMRGGRTEATVISREGPIVGLPPIVPRLDAMIVFHPEFLADALPRLIDGPLVVTDEWAWTELDGRGRVVRVPGREIAAELGTPVAAGFALLGAFAAVTGSPSIGSIASATRDLVPPHRVAALQANLAALDAGAEFVLGTPVGIS
jgi:2-oxoglutarate ferredoxin oxidoreductase subunit gamma